MVEAPKSLTCVTVDSRESVRIVLTLAALNDLEVTTSDIKNPYLTAPHSGKVHTTHGTEFGENKGKTEIIVRALYGWHHLVQASEATLQMACITLATNFVWQTLISDTMLEDVVATQMNRRTDMFDRCSYML